VSRGKRYSRQGYIEFKAQCPDCGRMVKGHLRNDEYTSEFTCDCGTVLRAMVYRQFEWQREGA